MRTRRLSYQERRRSASDGSGSPPVSPGGTKKKSVSKETTNPAGVGGYVVLCRPVALNGPEGQSSAQKWRRRELNESPQAIQGELYKELTESTAAAGVPQECLPFTGGRRVTLTDARLVSVASRWGDLPETLRDQLQALSLPPFALS